MSSTLFQRLAAGAVTLLLAATGRAALIDVNFTAGYYGGGGPGPTQSGAAATGASGDVWNGLSSSTAGSTPVGLVDSTGAASGASITYGQGSFSALQADGKNSYPFGPDAVASPVKNLFGSYLVDDGSNGNKVILTGLAPGAYNLYLYSSPAGNGQDRSTIFTANTLTATVGPNNNTSTLALGHNYAVLAPVVGSDGTLTIAFARGPATFSAEGTFNGFQLSAVPEPGSLCLLGLASVGVVVRRRRA